MARQFALYFQHAETLFIQCIDFFFQNFSNRCKKNNQLDTPGGSPYFPCIARVGSVG